MFAGFRFFLEVGILHETMGYHYMKIIYYLLALSFLLNGCSDNLSKGEAAELIKTEIEKQHRDPIYETFYWESLGQRWSGAYQWSQPRIDQIKQLSNDGYLQGESQGYGFVIRTFTEKAKPFITTGTNGPLDLLYLQIAKVDQLVVNSITCGKEREDQFGKIERNCEAKFAVEFKPTAPGEKLNRELPQSGTALFYLHDKVWETAVSLDFKQN
ncbi:MAG: hypothetical protein ACXVA2_23625 [Mucilaginibacter sp.]